MITGITIPLEIAVALVCMAALAGSIAPRVAGRWGDTRRTHPKARTRDPLARIFERAGFADSLDRAAARSPEQAVLRGRIDQLAAMRAIWSATERDEALSHVAAVMRAGLRRTDRLVTIEGEGFKIIVPGSDEAAGVGIAERLRDRLAWLPLPAGKSDVRLSASFGVAGRRRGESETALGARASRALKAALNRGADHVVAASDIEEVLYLPAPAPTSPDILPA